MRVIEGMGIFLEAIMMNDILQKNLDELKNNGYNLIILSGFDLKTLDALNKDIKDFNSFKGDLISPQSAINKIKELSTERENIKQISNDIMDIIYNPKCIVMTEWLYTFLESNFSMFMNQIQNKAMLVNNGRKKRTFQLTDSEESFLEGKYKLSEEVVDIEYKLLYKNFDFLEITSFDSLIEKIKESKIYALKISDKLRDKLLENQCQFVKKIEESDVQLFEELTKAINFDLKEYRLFSETHLSEKSLFNPIQFNGIIPSEALQKINFKNILKTVFSHDDFRIYDKYIQNSSEKEKIGQDELIKFLIEQSASEETDIRDLFFMAGTGSGKSLIFQFAAYVLKKYYNKTTVVISPLKSLMKDQKDNALESVLRIEYDNSDLTYEEQQAVKKRINDGNVDLVYLSPEKFIQSANYYLYNDYNDIDVGLMVIDEVHLVSSWGKTFRVDYCFLGDVIRKFNNKRTFPIMATSATCVNGGRSDTVGEISDLLHLKNPYVIMTNFVRRNIQMEMIQADDKDDPITRTVDEIKYLIDNKKKAIVYTSFVGDADYIVDDFKDKYASLESRIGKYHGSMDKDVKKMNQNFFKNNKTDVVVATKAFGMGVDIPDTDTIIHHDLPSNLSDYIQAIGRAGRTSNKAATARCFLRKNFMGKSEKLANMSVPSNWAINSVFQHIFSKIRTVKKDQKFTIALEDITYLFEKSYGNNNDHSDAVSKARIALFLIQRDLELKYGRPILYREGENYQYLYFTVWEEKEVELRQFIPSLRRHRSGRNGSVKDIGPLYSVNIIDIWENNKKNSTIRSLVNCFFNTPEKIFNSIKVYPRTLAKLRKISSVETIQRSMDKIFSVLTTFCSSHKYNGVKEDEFINFLKSNFETEFYNTNSKKIRSVFLNQFGTSNQNDNNNFLYINTNRNGSINRIKSLKYHADIETWRNCLRDIIYALNNDNEYFFRPDYSIHRKILNVMDILGFIKVSYSGGKNTVITMRCANEDARRKILKSGSESRYSNKLVTNIRKDTKREKEIAEKFYTMDMTNDQRWKFLEDYFLGKEML